ncbi:DsbA family protein [Rhizobium sp. ARZ01]|nr:DsbA family protein [Rhizobium sp. ARZ01]
MMTLQTPTGDTTPLTIDFFHDVVCGWCYVMSPRLRQVAGELDIEVRHRSFVLQDSRERMVQAFGSMEQAKSAILGHWEACAKQDDEQRIDIEGMRAESFEYPNGLAGAHACQAAHIMGGDAAHWDYFDAVQNAHLSQHRNIGNRSVLLDIAVELGFARDVFAAHMGSEAASERVRADRDEARKLDIRSIPTLIVGPDLDRLQTMPVPALKARLQAIMRNA